MTREEKISRLKDILAEINEDKDAVCYLTSEDNELIESVIEALEQESCDDCISRQALIDAYGDWYVEEGTEEGFIGTVKQLLELAQDLSSACTDSISRQPQPKIGRWKKMVSVYDMIEGKYRMIPYTHKDEELSNPPFYVCDCGNNSKKPTNYCPDCGTKMIDIPDINDGKMSEIPTGSESEE